MDWVGSSFTQRYYNDAVLSAAGLTRYVVNVDGYEIISSLATRADWVGTRVTLRSDSERCVLIPLSSEDDIKLKAEDTASILSEIELRGVKIWNDPIFRLFDVSIEGTELNATFCTDEFFRYRFTNGALHDELTQALIDMEFDLGSVIEREEELLPLRRKYLPPDSLMNLRTRICASGVNVLTAFARPRPYDDFGLILQQRSTNVSSRQGALSVIPAGLHQPTLEPEAEVAISRSIMRELFEEVFGGEEVQKRSSRLNVAWYEHVSKPMKWFRKHASAFDLIMTGIGISLLTGSATFSAVLVVHDISFWETYSHEMRTNWEASEQVSPVLSTKDPRLTDILRNLAWSDYSFQAVIEGLMFLKEKYPNRVILPVRLSRTL